MWMDNMVCSKHKTLAAAHRAARECEKNGGADHFIVKVEVLDYAPYKRPEPKTRPFGRIGS
jgi:hypothetical protein